MFLSNILCIVRESYYTKRKALRSCILTFQQFRIQFHAGLSAERNHPVGSGQLRLDLDLPAHQEDRSDFEITGAQLWVLRSHVPGPSRWLGQDAGFFAKRHGHQHRAGLHRLALIGAWSLVGAPIAVRLLPAIREGAGDWSTAAGGGRYKWL